MIDFYDGKDLSLFVWFQKDPRWEGIVRTIMVSVKTLIIIIIFIFFSFVAAKN